MDDEKAQYGEGNPQPAGVNGVFLYDLTGDGSEELIVVYSEGSASSEAMDNNIVLLVYTYERERAVSLLKYDHVLFDSGVSNISICSMDGRYLISTGSTRYFAEHIFYAQDGEVQDAMDSQAPYSAAEQAIYDEGIQYSLSGEAEAIQKIYLKRAGFSGENLQYVDGVSPDMGFWLFAKNPERFSETLERLGVKLPKELVSADRLLQEISYYGDPTLCKMDAQMARAYAEILDSLPDAVSGLENLAYGSLSDDQIQVLLCDFAGDGYPVLAVSLGDGDFFQLWGYEDGKAVSAGMLYPTTAVMGEKSQGTIDGNTVLEVAEYISYTGGRAAWEIGYYQISGGRITALHDLHYEERNAAMEAQMLNADENELGLWRQKDLDEGFRPIAAEPCYAENQLRHDSAVCVSDGIECGRMFKITDFDQVVTDQILPLASGAEAYGELTAFDDGYTGFSNRQALSISGSMSRSDLKTVLLAYADSYGRPTYAYPEVSHLFTSEDVAQMAKLFEETLQGEVGEIYQVSNDVYYLVVYQDGKACGGAVMKKILHNGNTAYRLIESSTELKTEEELQAICDEENTISNIILDFAGAAADSVGSLQQALDNMDGTTVNDLAKGEISAFIENAVTAAGMVEVESSKNQITVTGEMIQASLEQAQSQLNALLQVIDGISLNKEVTVTLRVVCTGLNEGKTIQVTFDSSLLAAMEGAHTLQVMLSNAQHSVSVSREVLQTLCDRYGQITVQLQNKDGKYLIGFVDGEGNDIEQLEQGITFTLPADHDTATILASYGDTSENWGGQFDSINHTLSFATPYAGTYEVKENEIAISDLDGLDEETANAIRFMVSKGYFALDEDGNFLPEGELNRYEFCEALVRMFFSLNRELETTFTDVPEDSVYYDYVASGEQDGIIEGFEDGTFRGERAVPLEQVIAFCSRTLADKKGYAYPENLEEYLSFTDRADISDWAVETVALAVRESLIDEGGALEPQRNISRAEAALMLYKLFMLLYEPPVTAMDIDDTSVEGGGITVPIVVGVCAAAAVCAGLAFAGVKHSRKVRKSREVQDQ